MRSESASHRDNDLSPTAAALIVIPPISIPIALFCMEKISFRAPAISYFRVNAATAQK